MKGFYQLADLSVQVEGTKKDLIRAQHVEREFKRACRRLREASGADEVFLRIDTDLEASDGRTFDKVRLRAYAPSGPKNYTIDVGTTEENPFGMYVAWDAPIEVYNRETGQVREIDTENVEHDNEESATQGGAGQKSAAQESASQGSAPQQNGQRRERHESEETSAVASYDQSKKRGPSPEEAARRLVQKARKHDAGQLAGEVTVSGAPLSQKLRGLAEYAGRDKGYVARVCDALSVGGFDEVAVGQAQDVAHMLLDEDMLQQNESFEPDGEMPF
jgi:hypothetical protein